MSQYNFNEYLGCLSDEHPELYNLISHERFSDAEQHVSKMDMSSWEFENEEMGGRGLAYNAAQKSADNRKVGMTRLLECFSSGSGIPDQNFKILDILGGDGTLARFCKKLDHQAPTIYTADISKLMIDACHAQALPCVRQSATTSLFQDNVLDGVLIAYGSHHLDSNARSQAVSEAHRTLKVGGHLVLHDFEIGGRCAEWFDSVVHPYSQTGHPHPHFSREEMFRLFENAGFCDINVFSIDDPFTLDGRSPEEAKHNAIMHMYDMYGLIKIGNTVNEIRPRLEQLISETLGPISIKQKGTRYIATIPREALVASGNK
ncbi:MAG: class I SAM-dependent methyltransferase [Arenicella sp.]|nr:class I SAM-dependent methyltransferase [Arenicella sp.]